MSYYVTAAVVEPFFYFFFRVGEMGKEQSCVLKLQRECKEREVHAQHIYFLCMYGRQFRCVVKKMYDGNLFFFCLRVIFFWGCCWVGSDILYIPKCVSLIDKYINNGGR